MDCDGSSCQCDREPNHRRCGSADIPGDASFFVTAEALSKVAIAATTAVIRSRHNRQRDDLATCHPGD
jgi:hypothetical protein